MSMNHEVLTPGAKKRFLEQLDHLRMLVQDDADRETIMHRTAELISPVVNQFAYELRILPVPRKPKQPHRCEGIIDPRFTTKRLRHG